MPPRCSASVAPTSTVHSQCPTRPLYDRYAAQWDSKCRSRRLIGYQLWMMRDVPNRCLPGHAERPQYFQAVHNHLCVLCIVRGAVYQSCILRSLTV